VFELNNNFKVTAFEDINGRSAIIVDDFYRDPDEVRELAISLNYNDGVEKGGFPGARGFLDTPEVKEKLHNIYLDLCNNKVWKIRYKPTQLLPDGSFKIPLLKKNRPFNIVEFEKEWSNQGFMLNVTNDDLMVKNPLGIIPHQDYWEDEAPTMQFGSVIFLNTPDECAGGTNLYSRNGEMSLPKRVQTWDSRMESWMQKLDGIETDIEKFKYIKMKVDEGSPFVAEFKAEMKYNRMVLYQSDVFHSADLDLGMFTNHNRINQILFM